MDQSAAVVCRETVCGFPRHPALSQPHSTISRLLQGGTVSAIVSVRAGLQRQRLPEREAGGAELSNMKNHSARAPQEKLRSDIAGLNWCSRWAKPMTIPSGLSTDNGDTNAGKFTSYSELIMINIASARCCREKAEANAIFIAHQDEPEPATDARNDCASPSLTPRRHGTVKTCEQ